MSFRQPGYLVGLVAIPLLIALYVLAQRRRRRFTLRFTNLALLKSVVAVTPGYRRHVAPALFILGALSLLLALAAPILDLELARSDARVMLVIDVSGSMEATDVQPTRLEAARSAARSLIDQLPANDRIGLVSFNGRATLDMPLTQDRGAVRSALLDLRANGATAIGEGLALALQQFGPAASAASGVRRPPSMIVLLTDGVSNSGISPLTAAAQARAAGVPVQTVGIGKRDAAVTVHGQDVGGVDESALQSIAEITGGRYYYAEQAEQLRAIYSSLGTDFGWQFLRLDLAVPMTIAGILAVLLAAASSLAWFRVLP